MTDREPLTTSIEWENYQLDFLQGYIKSLCQETGGPITPQNLVSKLITHLTTLATTEDGNYPESLTKTLKLLKSRMTSTDNPLAQSDDFLIQCGKFILNPRNREIMTPFCPEPISLSKTKTKLMIPLMINAGHFLSYEALSMAVWNVDDSMVALKTLTCRVRYTIGDNQGQHIRTKPTFGYGFFAESN